MVDADSLNVRNDASSSATVIDHYGPGEWIEVIGNDVNGFSPINYYGDVAWVATQYLSWDGEYRYASVGSIGGGSSSEGSSERTQTSASTSQEHWIQVNGATGRVDLMVGDSIYATYWGSVGFDTSSRRLLFHGRRHLLRLRDERAAGLHVVGRCLHHALGRVRSLALQWLPFLLEGCQRECPPERRRQDRRLRRPRRRSDPGGVRLVVHGDARGGLPLGRLTAPGQA